MLSKQETIELLRSPIYKVEVRLLFYPYTISSDVRIIGGKWVPTMEPSIERTLFDYIHTEESINKSIFDRGYVIYYLQIKGDEVHEVSREAVNGLGSIVEIGTTDIVLGLTQDGLYKIHKQY